MNWNIYIFLGAVIATVFFVAAAIALHWAHKHGQFSDLDRGSRSIFDEDEPMGEITDQFPARGRKRAKRGK